MPRVVGATGRRYPQRAMPTDDRSPVIEARRELHELAHLVARTCPLVDLERTLRILHPRAVEALPRREFGAIVELSVRPFRS